MVGYYEGVGIHAIDIREADEVIKTSHSSFIQKKSPLIGGGPCLINASLAHLMHTSNAKDIDNNMQVIAVPILQSGQYTTLHGGVTQSRVQHNINETKYRPTRKETCMQEFYMNETKYRPTWKGTWMWRFMAVADESDVMLVEMDEETNTLNLTVAWSRSQIIPLGLQIW